ncbi:MAG: glycerate kinase [candidate division FCPU426 bacterium]
MRLLIAPNAFKGTFSALQAARAIAAGVQRALPKAHLDLMPLADGGPGTLQCLSGVKKNLSVHDALGRPRRSQWLLAAPGLALIESSQAIGLTLIPEKKRDALAADSFGLGQLLLAARRQGCGRILVGLGGSATSDGGTGMARALGWRFLDSAGRDLDAGGGSLEALERIIPPAKQAWKSVEVLCDVDNPLFGRNGAAQVYSPQKGAGPAEVRRLDKGLRRLASFFPARLSSMPGAGAAGGLGFGLKVFCGAKLVPGAATLMALADFEARLKKADAVVSGEGRFDSQSLRGKLPYIVALRAVKAKKSCALICGSVQSGIRIKGVSLLGLSGRSLGSKAATWAASLSLGKAGAL